MTPIHSICSEITVNSPYFKTCSQLLITKWKRYLYNGELLRHQGIKVSITNNQINLYHVPLSATQCNVMRSTSPTYFLAKKEKKTGKKRRKKAQLKSNHEEIITQIKKVRDILKDNWSRLF